MLSLSLHPQGHLTPDTVAYASGLGTGLILGALFMTVAAIWYVSKRPR